MCLNQLLLEVFVLFPTDFLLTAMGFGDSKKAVVSVCTLNSCAQGGKNKASGHGTLPESLCYHLAALLK